MADNKAGREKQAQDADRRQRERAIEEELERMDEPEPPVDTSELAYFETNVKTLSYPTTPKTVVETLGDEVIDAGEKTYAVADLLPETDVETYGNPEEVRERIQRPTTAMAMKRVVEASESIPNTELGNSQVTAYEKTFRALKDVDAVDNEDIEVLTEWIVDQIHERDTIPDSPEVRREAAKFCREQGYEVQADEWLGV